MNVSPSRRPLKGRTAVSRASIALLAVPPVLIGMLLMHVVTSDVTAAIAAASATFHAQELHSDHEVAADPNQPQPSLEDLVCILALLVGIPLLTLSTLTSRQMDTFPDINGSASCVGVIRHQ